MRGGDGWEEGEPGRLGSLSPEMPVGGQSLLPGSPAPFMSSWPGTAWHLPPQLGSLLLLPYKA